MNYLTEDAWDLPASSKIDVLEEPEHTHLILRFCSDRNTEIELDEDKNLILYGSDQAVLVLPPVYPTTRLMLFYYRMIYAFREALYSRQNSKVA